MAYDTTSYIYREGVTPVTRTAISSRAKIFSFAAEGTTSSLTQIGHVSSFNPSHSRTIDTKRGIGMGDKIAELVPQNADAVTISVERTMLYVGNLMQAFGYNAGTSGIVRSLAHHRFPFDIRHELILPNFIVTNNTVTSNISTATDTLEEGAAQAIATIYEACWFNDYSLTYSVDDVVIAESGTVTVTDVYDPANLANYTIGTFLGGNASSAGSPFSTRFSQAGTSGSGAGTAGA